MEIFTSSCREPVQKKTPHRCSIQPNFGACKVLHAARKERFEKSGEVFNFIIFGAVVVVDAIENV